ncbi:ABC transporter ATP-binding protein (plasmid) [Isosphaeraceae bacterium EP7]
MDPILTVQGLSKAYTIGTQLSGHDRYRTVRESISESVSATWTGLRRRLTTRCPAGDGLGWNSRNVEKFWALNDVSFEVQPGEVVGIVGRNGAGKSTLLKVLSRITEPTKGRVEMNGRVGSLLEVGTGFHPELTGRENIFLNGAILGMSRKDILRNFDAIVAFSEIEKFLDTPVKRYSSGMYVRLAFAVASHLEPEILVVDEVLAVGDAAFQKKCLNKMDQVSRSGRTVLFVSHTMSAIKSLCTRALLIEGGRVALDGNVDEVVNHHLAASAESARTGVIPENAVRQNDVKDQARFRSVKLTTASGDAVAQVYFGQKFRVTFVCEVLRRIEQAIFEVSISTLDGTQVTYSTTLDGEQGPISLSEGLHEVSAEIDIMLLPRDYTIDLGVHHLDGTTVDLVRRTYDFTVLRVAEYGNDHYPWPRTRGMVRAQTEWELEGSTAGTPTRSAG